MGIEAFYDCVLVHADNCLRDGSGAPLLSTCLRRGQKVSEMGAWQKTVSGQILPSKLASQPYPVDFPLGKPKFLKLSKDEHASYVDEIIFIPTCNVNHFGHLLTETAAYLGGLLHGELKEKLNDGTIIMLANATEQTIDIVSLLTGIKRERIRSTLSIKGILRCRTAWLPKPTMVNRFGIHTNHFTSLRLMVNQLAWMQSNAPEHYPFRRSVSLRMNETTPSSKIYISRSMLHANQRCLKGEKKLEQSLARNGWVIIHPETMTLATQIKYLKTAEVIASPIGSALHLLMYFGDKITTKRVVGLGLASGRLNPNFIFQFQRQRVSFTNLCCLEVDHASAHPNAWSDLKLVASPEHVADAIEGS